MKRLMYLSISVFFLALTLMVGVHIGQQTATASPEHREIVGFAGVSSQLWVLTSNGDVYTRSNTLDNKEGTEYPAIRVGNFWQ